jgi:dipeptidyl aminopeptidase/acylaminoacyl peptidase
MDILSSSGPVTAASALALLALAGCTTDAAGPATTAEHSDPPPLVLFQAEGPTHLLVATARADGSEVTFPLEDLPGGDQTNPDWSPDGSRVVFVVDDGARGDLWVADADGSDPRLLLDCSGPCRYLDDPAWSPDGARVVFSRTTARGADALGSLETVDVDGGAVDVWLEPRLRSFTAGARWSPDGSAVVFESIRTDGRRLGAEVDGIVLRVLEVGSHRPGPALTDPDTVAATAAWSPDGARIAYSALARPGAAAADLFVIPATGGSPRQVTHLVKAGGYAAEPTWRADSVTLVFSGRVDAGFGGPGTLLSVDTSDGTVADLGEREVVGRHPRTEPGA